MKTIIFIFCFLLALASGNTFLPHRDKQQCEQDSDCDQAKGEMRCMGHHCAKMHPRQNSTYSEPEVSNNIVLKIAKNLRSKFSTIHGKA